MHSMEVPGRPSASEAARSGMSGKGIRSGADEPLRIACRQIDAPFPCARSGDLSP